MKSRVYIIATCGLDYKQITIVIDASKVVSEWCHNFEHNSGSVTDNSS